MTAIDWSCVPCCGQKCFGLPLIERKACSPKPVPCPFHVKNNPEWLCRCCSECVAECLKEANGE